MQLLGIHHLTAITGDASGNHAFYTDVLGLRLVKKTVNQDDVSAYHLFYADALASPGSDLTFFHWPLPPERRGSRSIIETGLRVAGTDTLAWWRDRLTARGVACGEIAGRDGRAVLPFADFEGQRLCLVDDGGAGPSHPWERSPVPTDRQIRGLGPITICVPDLPPTARVLTDLMGMRAERTHVAPATGLTVHVFAMGAGGPGAELHVAVDPRAEAARQGVGGAHHVAFRIPDAAYDGWSERLRAARVPSSGPVDRYYFRSLYFREPSGILFELATEGPGFTADEPLETLGSRLALPPFLEHRRGEIEANLAPLA